MKRIITATLCMAILTGCGQTEQAQSAAEQPVTSMAETTEETETTTAANTTAAMTTDEETTAESTTAIAVEPEYTEEDIKSAQTWMTKVWNICVDIEAYSRNGTDCTGKEIDMDFYMKGAELEYTKRDEYDAAVHALDDSVPAQGMFILAWDKCLEQSDALFDKAFNEPPRPNDETYDFNIDLFRQYSTQLRNYMNEMMYGSTDKVAVTTEDKIELIFKK